MSVHLWLSILWMALSLFFSLTHSSMRDFSAVLFERIMRRKGREALLDRFFKLEDDLLTITMTLRLCVNLLFVLTVAYAFAPSGPSASLDLGRWAMVFVVSLGCIAVFSAGIPRAIAHYRGAQVLASVLSLLLGLRVLLLPVVWLARLTDEVVRRLAGVAESEDPAEDLEDELMSVVTEGAREGTLDEEERQMIEGVIEFRSTDAGETMTPRTDVIGIEADASLDDIRRVFKDSGHSRLPVYEKTMDGIVGVLYAKDLLAFIGGGSEPFEIRKVMREAVFVPEQIPLTDLLDTFQERRIHMAVVLDEYGGTAGIVTVEDVLEEIVGDLHDEREASAPVPDEGIVQIEPTIVEADGRERIDDVNDALDISLPEDEEYDTIGGYVFSHLGHIPKRGESFDADEVRITVLDAGPRRVRRVRVERIKTNGNGSE